jgi:hypothetical protein
LECIPDQIIHRKLDGLLGRDTNQLRQNSRVKTAEALVGHDLPEAVDRVVIQTLTRVGSSLVLQSRLDQVDGVHHEGAKGTGNTSQAKVIGRLGNAVQSAGRGGLGSHNSGRVLSSTARSPGGIEDLGKVHQAEPARGLIQTGKVEQDIGLHGGEEREAGDLGRLVEELGLGDLAVGALLAGLADDELNQVHLLHHVLEGADVGIRDSAAEGDVAESSQVLQQVVRELVLGRLPDDALKVLGLDVAIAILVKLQEGLSDALSLQTTEHLGKLLVREGMAPGLVANVQLRPLAVPVKGDALGSLVQLVETAEVVVLHGSAALDIKESEGNLVLGIGLEEQVVERGPVGKADTAIALAIGDVEEEAVLLALDLALQ